MWIKRICALVVTLAMCLQITATISFAEKSVEKTNDPVIQMTNSKIDEESNLELENEPKKQENESIKESATKVKVRNARSVDAVKSNVIDINSKEDFLKLYNSEISNSVGVLYDEKTYGVRGKTINLNTDISVSSDEINAQFPENTKFKNYERSFQLSDSDFHGNGHTITITQGERNIYPLFGNVENSTNSEKTIDNLNIVYKGNVYGSGFARSINSSFYKEYINIHNIDVKVEGDILPIVIYEIYLKTGTVYDKTPVGAKTMATGFAGTMDYVRGTKINVHVDGNIGSINQPKVYEVLNSDFYKKDSEAYPDKYKKTVSSDAYGFTSGYTFANDNVGFVYLDDINVDIGNSLISHGIYCGAQSGLFGGGLGKMKMENINVKAGGDVLTIIDDNNGEVENDKVLFLGNTAATSYASGFGFGIHYLNNANISVGGNITVDNRINYETSIAALGISYDNGIARGLENIIPRTIKNVNLNVNGNVQALTNQNLPFDFSGELPQVASVAGAGNFDEPFADKQNGVYSENNFENNNITVNGEVKVDANRCNGLALLWGGLTGQKNTFNVSKINLNAKGEDWDVVAPFYEVFKANNNRVNIGTIESVSEGKGYVSAFGYSVYRANNNKVNVGDIKTTGAYSFGGYACKLAKVPPYYSRGDVEPKVYDEHITLPESITFKKPSSSCMIGGFSSQNNGIPVENCSVSIPKEIVVDSKQSVNVGGFVSASFYDDNVFEHCNADIGKIDVKNCASANIGGFSSFSSDPVGFKNSKAHIGDIKVETPGTANIGGFLGKAYNYNVENCAALIDGNIEVNGAYWPNAGGFAGYLYNGSIKNSAAQIGGDIVLDNAGGTACAAGFAGHCYGTDIERSTALTFGNIKGKSNKMACLSAFVGDFDVNPKSNVHRNNSVKNSAAYLGGNI